MPSLKKLTAGSAEAAELGCSFCGRSDDEVDLIAGGDTSICAVCVAACNDLLLQPPDKEDDDADDGDNVVEDKESSVPEYFRLLTADDVTPESNRTGRWMHFATPTCS